MKSSVTATIILFFSGLAALIYQTIWIKQLALVVGVEVYAVTIGISAFFTGLALGNLWIGRWTDRSKTPLRLYAGLEFGIAITGVATTWTLAHSDRLFVSLQDTVGFLAWGWPLLLVGIPATLMGGTLVALLRACEPAEELVGRTAGLLYAANTAGAIAGTLITAFYLIVNLGIQHTAWAAATINIILALAALSLQSVWQPAVPSPNLLAKPQQRVSLALVLYAIAGGLALGYEVIWTQAIVQFLSTRAYAFAVILATYLLGLTLGSWVISFWSDRLRYPWVVFGSLIASAGIFALASFTFTDIWLLKAQHDWGLWAWQLTHNRMAMKLTTFAVATGVFVLLPTLCLGAAYPLAIRLVTRTQHVGKDTGLLTALNTLGGIVGTGVTGFLLVPHLGLVHSMVLLAGVATIVGAIAVLQAATGPASKVAIGTAVVAVMGLAVITPADNFAQMLTIQHPGKLLFHQESAGNTVAVIEQPTSQGSFHRLYIQGVSNTGDVFPSLRYMRLQALLPLIIHSGQPRSAMVVGLGSGITSGSLLTYPDLEEQVTYELLPPVIEAAQTFDGNFEVTRNPRATIEISDGRHELLRTQKQFDLITLEPPPPSASGVVNLYSRDFYELAKSKLAPDGLFAQWWPLATQNDADSRSLARSMLDAFPYVTVWSTEFHEMMLIGSMCPLELQPEQIRERFAIPSIQTALTEIGIQSPQALLATYVTDRTGLESYVQDAPAVTDDRPLIEYADWVRPGEIARVLPEVMKTNTVVPLPKDDPWQAEINQERYNLSRLYKAQLSLYEGEDNDWYYQIVEVLEADPDNAYYRWMFKEST
ncbi:MAG: fused MFS/spermidine synthase [Leptolyngbyaceae cyanobacterium]